MFTLFFTEEKEISSLEDALKSNTKQYAKYFQLSLEKGIYLPPSQYEAAFLSAAHTVEDINKTLEISLNAMKFIADIELQ
jgi:glutamate-1-semialdehyde 2,1-aminomutase